MGNIFLLFPGGAKGNENPRKSINQFGRGSTIFWVWGMLEPKDPMESHPINPI
jgi:hypothetical protein